MFAKQKPEMIGRGQTGGSGRIWADLGNLAMGRAVNLPRFLEKKSCEVLRKKKTRAVKPLTSKRRRGIEGLVESF